MVDILTIGDIKCMTLERSPIPVDPPPTELYVVGEFKTIISKQEIKLLQAIVLM